MKKLFVLLAGAMILLSCSSSDKEQDNSKGRAEKNIAACNAVIKSIETGDVSKLDDYIAKDIVDHAGMTGDIKGLDSLKKQFLVYAQMSTDMRSTVVKELADDEYVVQWLHHTGIAKTPAMGLPPGTRYDMQSVHISKFNKEGKIAEHWEFVDMKEMMKMMNAPPPPPSTADSVKIK